MQYSSDEITEYAFHLLFIIIVISCLRTISAIVMTESLTKTRKQNETKTSLDRNIVNANWLTFLAVLSDKEKNPPPQRTIDIPKSLVRTQRKRTKKRSLDTAVQNAAVNGKIKSPLDSAENRKPTLTKCIAIDCEMVGIGEEGKDNMLARVSLVNTFGDCLYDKFVKPREPVVDYRTSVSGVRKENVADGESFKVVQQEVADLLRGRILVGHAVKHDLAVLFLSHPNRSIRDTSKYKPFRKLNRGGTPSLKKLTAELLGVQIQKGEHSSVEDARATMQLYWRHSKQWEASAAAKDRRHRPVKPQKPAELQL